MEISENIWNFYQNTVELLQKDSKSANNFVEQAATSMLCGQEFGDNDLNSVESYETSFVWNLTYNNLSKEGTPQSLEEILEPLSEINKDSYFNWLVTHDVILPRKVLMCCRLANAMENEEAKSITISLLKLSDSKLKEAYKSFSNMKEIIRTGWIARNVAEPYRENDAMHIMQMFTLALAYFRLDKTINLDQKKVYEMILLHEIGEVLAGDIREGASGHETKHDIEREAVVKTFSNLNKVSYFINLWDEFEENSTEEAKFVYQLDKIDPVLKANFLDEVLERDDLFPDFFNYEEKRNTFAKGKVKELFLYSKEAGRRQL